MLSYIVVGFIVYVVFTIIHSQISVDWYVRQSVIFDQILRSNLFGIVCGVIWPVSVPVLILSGLIYWFGLIMNE